MRGIPDGGGGDVELLAAAAAGKTTQQEEIGPRSISMVKKKMRARLVHANFSRHNVWFQIFHHLATLDESLNDERLM